jgi:hypothetical protein
MDLKQRRSSWFTNNQWPVWNTGYVHVHIYQDFSVTLLSLKDVLWVFKFTGLMPGTNIFIISSSTHGPSTNSSTSTLLWSTSTSSSIPCKITSTWRLYWSTSTSTECILQLCSLPSSYEVVLRLQLTKCVKAHPLVLCFVFRFVFRYRFEVMKKRTFHSFPYLLEFSCASEG